MITQKKVALAARYRPQTFGEVAGQDMVKAVLSRACAEDRPACAYLLSGTRGVGKTTMARILAKALNCVHAPVAEPCNQCPQCTKIMQGTHVDVLEIDGASNNSVEDVRTLRETVGYAPMEGRYKVFIIDEAHMLSGSAFNALLKTLEEPPPHVVFILATTEAHKFPVTIVSRCQHFTFRHLNEEEIIAHLKKVLQKEALPFEEEAVRLIAKRAQGSVRDSMSLLDQTLALGNESLTVDVTREVLGLAGQAFFEQLFRAMCTGDLAGVITHTRELLRRGVDIGFFLRELQGYLRNLFLLAQSGPRISATLALTPGEEQFLSQFVGQFSAAHLHAAWQLVLEGQRSVVLSTEPSSALELLLLNLSMIPNLLPIANIPVSAWGAETKAQEQREKASPAEQKTDRDPRLPEAPSQPQTEAVRVQEPAGDAQTEEVRAHVSQQVEAVPADSAQSAVKAEEKEKEKEEEKGQEDTDTPLQKRVNEGESVQAAGPEEARQEEAKPAEEVCDAQANTNQERELESEAQESLQEPLKAPLQETLAESEMKSETVSEWDLEESDPDAVQEPQEERAVAFDWDSFITFYLEHVQSAQPEGAVHFAERDLRGLMVRMNGTHVQISPLQPFQYERLMRAKAAFLGGLRSFLRDESVTLEIVQPEAAPSLAELVDKMEKRQELNSLRTLFEAYVERVNMF